MTHTVVGLKKSITFGADLCKVLFKMLTVSIALFFLLSLTLSLLSG